MARTRSQGTAPETALFAILRKCGYRPLAQVATLPGKPDAVLRKQRLAIFVDGEFWHGVQWRRRGLCSLEEQFGPKSNAEYWVPKIRRTMARDAASAAALLASGWRVLRVWESDLQATLFDPLPRLGAEAPPDALAAAQLAPKAVAEFFAGIGLMRMGLEREGWRVTFANDHDEGKCALYRGHFGAADELRCADVRTIRADQLPLTALATASFPCTDLSIAGAQRGLRGAHSSMFWEFARLLGELAERRPPLVLLENVHGLITSQGGADLRACLGALNELKYTVDVLALDACSFTPQSRPRLFIVGVSAALGCPGDIAPEFVEPDALRPQRLADFVRRHADLHWALRRLPAAPAGNSTLADVLDDLPDDDPCWWSAARAEYLLNQMSPRHRDVAERMMQKPAWSYGAVFRRMRRGRSTAELRTDGMAGCLRTPRGGSARQILFRAGRGGYAVRLLTPRECARLMGAGDYRITGSHSRALFGFGDAVCVPAVAWLARHYLNPIVNESLRGRVLSPGAEVGKRAADQPADRNSSASSASRSRAS